MSIFNERLQELKDERGIQSKAIAEALNITPSKVSYYMRGVGEPPYELLNKFADFFDVTTDYLTGRTNQRDKNSEVTIESIKAKASQTITNTKRVPQIEIFSEDLYNILARLAELEADKNSYDDIWDSVKMWLSAMQDYCNYVKSLSDDPYPIDIAKETMDSLTNAYKMASSRIFNLLRDICIDDNVPLEIKKRVVMHSSFGIRPPEKIDNANE